MARKAPGRHERQGLSLVDITRIFPDGATAEEWFVKNRWPAGACCPECASLNVQERPTRKPQPYRCRDCRKDFSVKTGTLMHNSKLGLQTWAIALYLLSTGLKGTSSMKIHRDLGVTQKTAWFLAHRIRETWRERFSGPLEMDELYSGGKEQNKHESKKLKAGRGAVGKTAVGGVKDRNSNRIAATPVASVSKVTVAEILAETSDPDAPVYTDEGSVYGSLPHHESVKRSAGEYVSGKAHVNGIESFWSLLRRGYYGRFHKLSCKRLDRYVNEFAGRHNLRDLDPIQQLCALAATMHGKQLHYKSLIQGNGPVFGRTRDRGVRGSVSNRAPLPGDNLAGMRGIHPDCVDLISSTGTICNCSAMRAIAPRQRWIRPRWWSGCVWRGYSRKQSGTCSRTAEQASAGGR